MTDKELKRLSRGELLGILIAQMNENEKLKAELAEVRQKLEAKEIKAGRAGSIAEAALVLNGVFEAAQAASQQYIENIRNLEESCIRLREEAEKRAAEIIAEAESKASQREEKTKQQTDQYWMDVSTRLERFYLEHQSLREILDAGSEHRLPGREKE